MRYHIQFFMACMLLYACSAGDISGKEEVPSGTENEATSQKVSGASQARDFTLQDISGRPFRLSDHQGKVIILDFWATWCPPCRQEIPAFIELYDEYRDAGLLIVGISLDNSLEKLREFVDAKGINYPVMLGDNRVTGAYGGIRGIPTTFIIDRNGEIVEKFVGYRDKAVFEEAIKRLI